MPTELKEIIDHFTDEMEHNLKWADIEKYQGNLFAAERRTEHADKLKRWIAWLER